VPLVHEDHVPHPFGPLDRLVPAGTFLSSSEAPLDSPVENVDAEGALSRARYAGDRREDAEGDNRVDALEVVLGSAAHGEKRPGAPPSRRHGDAEGAAQIPARRRLGTSQQALEGPAVEKLSPPLARTRSQVHDVVRPGHDFRVMLDDDDGVALVAKGFQDLEEPAAVAGMESHRGLIEDEQGVDERRAEGLRQAHALHLAARERSGLPVEGQVP